MQVAQQVEVTNIPTWTLYVIAVMQVVFVLAVIGIGFVLASLLKQIQATVADVQSIVTNEVRREILPTVNATLKNVKAISDDAREATHNVSGTVNRVSHVANSVAGRLESPLVKTVGALTGVAAGVRTLRGGKKEVVVKHEPKKRGGLLGFLK